MRHFNDIAVSHIGGRRLSLTNKVVFYLVLFLLFGLVEMFVAFGVMHQYNHAIEEHLEDSVKKYDKYFATTLDKYKEVSIATAIEIARSDKLQEIVQRSNDKTNYQAEHKELLDKFPHYYQDKIRLGIFNTTIYNVKGDVLVRFHAPDRYGDNLLAGRKTLRDVYDTGTPQFGFEIGEYNTAYRFAFPIFDNKGEFIGSVDVGFKDIELLDSLRLNIGMGVYMAVFKDEFKKISKSDEHVASSYLGDNFVHNRYFEGYEKSQSLALKKAMYYASENAADKIKNKVPFELTMQDNVIVGHPMEDYEGRKVGYVVFYDEDGAISILKNGYWLRFLIFSILAGMFLDVSLVLYAKQAEKTKTEKQLDFADEILNNINESVLIVNKDGMFRYANNKAKTSLGYSEVELTKMGIFDIDKELTKEKWSRAFGFIFDSNKNHTFSVEAVHTTKDGQHINVQIGVSVYEYDKERFVSFLCSDLAERKKQEVELRQSENRLRDLLEKSPIAVVITKGSGQDVIFSNRAYSKLLGGQDNEVGTKSPADYYAEPLDYYNVMFELEQGRQISNKLIELAVSQDLTKWVVASYSPTTHDGEPAVLAWFFDVTEQKKLETELEKMNEHLTAMVELEVAKRIERDGMMAQQSKLAIMGEMISMIAHQWRQPLSSLAVNIQNAEVAFVFNELDLEYMKKFKNDTMGIINRMSTTIDDFRDFFKPDDKEQTFLAQVAIEDALNIIGPILATNGVAINFDKEQKNSIYGHKNKLEQVILILLSNAKDVLVEMKVPDSAISIEVQDIPQDGKVEICVQDNGGGIPDEIIGKIFEPYFSTKGKNGTGIGLYMSKEIIERHGNGKISVENINGGARFRVLLDRSNEKI